MKPYGNLIILLVITLLVTGCEKNQTEYIDIRGSNYAGSQSCIQCHSAIYDSHIKSLHHLASAPGKTGFVKGDFSKKAVFKFDSITKLVMEKRKDSFYQVLYKNDEELKAYNMSVVFGSEHAQTSVYWDHNVPYELPVSYYAEIDKWAGSPGGEFKHDSPNFSRPVTRDCFSCHSSNAAATAIHGDSSNLIAAVVPENHIDPETIVYGIDCERCHGPGEKHVRFHQQFPDSLGASYIVEVKSLSRKQKLDACAICHSGDKGMKIRSRFDFITGENLEEYFRSLNPSDTANMDVHGNQYQLMAQSECFRKSETLNCMTCHDAHGENDKNLSVYSQICANCHSNFEHTSEHVLKLQREVVNSNCIDCHMPKKSSKAIQFHQEMDSNFTKYSLRSHLIDVYKNVDID